MSSRIIICMYKRVSIHQKKYAQDILKRFKMNKCNAAARPLEIRAKLRKETNDEFLSVTFYKQIIGSLRYLCNTRPYICQSVGLLSRFMDKPQEWHFIAVKRMLRYIKGYDWSWCSDVEANKDQSRCKSIWLHWFGFKWRSWWNTRVLHATYSWSKAFQSHRAQGKHHDFVILWNWVRGCIICNMLSSMDRNVARRVQDSGT